MRPQDIDAAWLSHALQQRYPGTIVTALDHGRFIGGTGSKLQLRMHYNDIGEAFALPPSMFIKAGLEWHEHQFKASYQAEAVFYETWAPRITANIPKAYYAARNARQGVVLIEDLTHRDVRFGRADNPLSAGDVVRVIDLLADIHAQTWQDPHLAGLRTLGERVGGSFMFMLEADHYAKALASSAGRCIPASFHDPATVLKGLKANWAAVDTGPQSFCHGDPHQGNLFFEPGGRPGYLDFQAYVRASPLHDINYMLVGSMTPEDRRRHERDLLTYYLAQLRARDLPGIWTFEEAWYRFQRHTMHGLMWFVTPTTMQPIDIIKTSADRFGTAAADYDLPKLLGLS